MPFFLCAPCSLFEWVRLMFEVNLFEMAGKAQPKQQQQKTHSGEKIAMVKDGWKKENCSGL